MRYMSIKEKAAELRKELKAMGISSRKVSVRGSYCGYSDALDVVVKDPTIDVEKINEAARKFESVDRDEYSGEILAGGNTYVDVREEYGLYDEVRKPEMELAETLFNALTKNEGKTESVNGVYVYAYDGMLCFSDGENKRRANTVKEIATLIYKAKTFGKVF